MACEPGYRPRSKVPRCGRMASADGVIATTPPAGTLAAGVIVKSILRARAAAVGLCPSFVRSPFASRSLIDSAWPWAVPLAIALSPAAVLAQPSTAAGSASAASTIVVTGARLAQPISESPLDIRVIDREALDRAGAGGLAELLQRLGGVEITANGGPGQPGGLFLRGSNSSHVLLLVDGVRVSSATSGTNAFEHLTLDQIDRIEVLLGPASGLYGADAIGGVVQVFTRREDGAAARIALASDRTRQLSASLGRSSGSTRASLSLAWRSTDADSATNADNLYSYAPDRDPYQHASVGASVEHDWARGQTLALRGTLAQARTHFDAGPFADDLNRQRLVTLALESRNRVAAGWTSLLRLARGTDDLQTVGSFPGGYRTDQDQFTWQNDIDLAGGRVAAGLEWRQERVDSDTTFTRDDRRVASVFAGWSGALAPGHRVQAALRHDRNSQFGGRTTGNLGWAWALAPGWRLNAAAGTAFKAPSFNDLYYPLQFGYSGNPDLAPERSRSVEFGLRHESGPLQLGATAFSHRIRDLIVINDSFTTVENIGSARIGGLTLQARWAAGPWAARAEATLQSPRNADTGAQLVRRAERYGSAGLDWTSGAWRLGAELVVNGTRFDDGANSAAARLGGYSLLNLSAAWTVAPAWTLSMRVDNATDHGYTMVRGYDTPGRRVQFSLAWQGG